MGLTRARLIAKDATKRLDVVEVMFNPAELSIDQSVAYAEHPVLGSVDPILQFVRAEGRTMNVELFLDGTDENRSVEESLAALRQFVERNEELHAPPLCEFSWGDVTMTAVVKSLNEKYVLFGQDGSILRARVTMSLRRFETPDFQERDKKLSSPDRTRVRVLREGETLAHIALEAYGDARRWPVIAEANGIDKPRFIPVGTPLKVPAI
jgi:contractile injection system tube protein